MKDPVLLHLHPTLRMIQEELTQKDIACYPEGPEEDCRFRGVRYYDGTPPQKDQLYILRPGDNRRFPSDEFPYITTFPVTGKAPHLLCPHAKGEELLNLLLDLFAWYRDLEMRLDELVYRNAGLHALCEIGAEMLGNPVCIHDNWFIMVAMSRELPEVMQPDYIMASTRMFIPRAIIEDFKYDTDYLETYSHRSAQIWQATPDAPKCLYVNLWVGDIYQGRLLVIQYHWNFRASDYMLAEYLAQRAGILLHRKKAAADQPYRSMDGIVRDIFSGTKTDSEEVTQLLHMLNWNATDSLICIRAENQQPAPTLVMEHVLHSDLFQAFPKSYIMFEERRQCVVLNLTQNNQQFSQIRHTLSPICRDYCLYAGISSPVSGIGEMHLAYLQAGEALEHAFRLRCDRWIIPFSDCAMDYILRNLNTPFPMMHLASPELRRLIEYDKEKGTQYFETLRTYLLLERDIPRTSEALIVHRTTLLYRLKKIQAMTELNLDDPQNRLYLLTSLKILGKL